MNCGLSDRDRQLLKHELADDCGVVDLPSVSRFWAVRLGPCPVLIDPLLAWGHGGMGGGGGYMGVWSWEGLVPCAGVVVCGV
jgi:hypothetical protein